MYKIDSLPVVDHSLLQLDSTASGFVKRVGFVSKTSSLKTDFQICSPAGMNNYQFNFIPALIKNSLWKGVDCCAINSWRLFKFGFAFDAQEKLAAIACKLLGVANKKNNDLPKKEPDFEVEFRNCKIKAEDLVKAMSLLGSSEKFEKINDKIARYGLYQHEQKGKKTIEIWIEFKREKDFNQANESLLLNLFQSLVKINNHFLVSLHQCPDEEKPVLRVFKKEESPMACQQEKYPEIKKLLFNEHDEFVFTHLELSLIGKIIPITNLDFNNL